MYHPPCIVVCVEGQALNMRHLERVVIMLAEDTRRMVKSVELWRECAVAWQAVHIAREALGRLGAFPTTEAYNEAYLAHEVALAEANARTLFANTHGGVYSD